MYANLIPISLFPRYQGKNASVFPFRFYSNQICVHNWSGKNRQYLIDPSSLHDFHAI